jgi:hypothetical protein
LLLLQHHHCTALNMQHFTPRADSCLIGCVGHLTAPGEKCCKFETSVLDTPAGSDLGILKDMKISFG